MKNQLQAFCLSTCFLFLSLFGMAQLNNPKNIEFTWNTDTTKAIVPLSEITVVLPRGAFPSIDNPPFLGREAALNQFFEHEPVISVEIDGAAKAYSLNMLTMHEISNDELSGVPILPTFCPLCNSSVVYDRRFTHEGQTYILDFEVSGMLRNSDMVMADKQTHTWWQQLNGMGIVGQFAGQELEIIPSLVISVEEFFDRYPDGRILSPDIETTAKERYGKNPYVGYDDLEGKPYERFFQHDAIDDRLNPMERLIDLRTEKGVIVFPFSDIEKQGVINYTFKGTHVVIFHKKGTVSVLDKGNIRESKAIGSATMFSPIVDEEVLTFSKVDNSFLDKQTNSRWDITGLCVEGSLKGKQLQTLPHSNHFAFAFLRFFPNTEIYSPE